MRMIRLMRLAAALFIAAGLILVVVSNGYFYIALSMVCIGISICLLVYAERKASELRIAKLREEKDRDLMKALSHYRHDWMNDLQVLFGYISLKKYDKLAPYLEKIKDKLSEESHIANLGNSSLSLLLMSYRLYSQNYELSVSMDKSVKLNDIPVRQDRLAQHVRDALQIFHQSAMPSPAEQNLLELTVVTTEDQIQLIYQFTGQYDPKLKQSMDRWSAGLQDDGSIQCEYHFEENQADLLISIQY